MQTSVLVTGQIDHDRGRPVGADPRRSPNVLVDTERGHLLESLWLSDACGGLDLDRVPAGVPVHAEVAGQRRHRGVVVAQRVGCPPHRAHRQDSPWRRQIMVLAERRGGAAVFSAPPDPLQPAHQRHPAEAGSIVHEMDPAAVADRQHSTGWAAVLEAVGLNRQHEPLPVINLHVQDVHVGNVEHRVGTRTPARATHRVRHRWGLRQRAWSPLILKAPTPSPRQRHAAQPGAPSTTLRSEEPVCVAPDVSPLELDKVRRDGPHRRQVFSWHPLLHDPLVYWWTALLEPRAWSRDQSDAHPSGLSWVRCY